MRVPGGPSIWKRRLWRLWCGARWRTHTILILSTCSTTVVFPWSTLVPSSVEFLVLPVPHGPKIFLRRRSAALRRSTPSARRTALVSRPHISHLRARTARRTHPERAARTESGRAPPSGPERCNRTIAAPDGDLRPLLPRRCTPRLGCRNAVRRRTSTTVLTKQTKPSVPDRGIQLKG